jgi:predicted Zn-dependent protease
VKPGERPPLETDEAGLWMQMDRVEANLKTSGRVVTDPAVNAYVREIVCRLAPEHCRDLRIYVVRVPSFNASMAPNGVMQVWTGLLLRAENEAQLAFVLGHEIGHYLRRHSLQRFRDLRAKTSVTTFFSIISAAAGVGFVGSLAQLAALGTVLEFSRDNEREADELGLDMMRRAGYEPHEAARIWEALLAERAVAKTSEPLIFFATHPPTKERIATLEGLAGERRDGSGYDVRTESYARVMGPLRATLLRDEVRTRDWERSLVVLGRLIAGGEGLGELSFYQGEIYRMRDDKGDATSALDAYRRALEFADAPAETWRAVGLLCLRPTASGSS